jgi:hypothetical protein
MVPSTPPDSLEENLKPAFYKISHYLDFSRSELQTLRWLRGIYEVHRADWTIM